MWSNWAANKGKSIKISPVSSLAQDFPPNWQQLRGNSEKRETFPPSSRRRRCSSSLSLIPPPLPRDLFFRLNLKWRLYYILRRRSPPRKRKHAFVCVYNTEGVAQLYLSRAVSEGATRWRQRSTFALDDVISAPAAIILGFGGSGFWVHSSELGKGFLFVCFFLCLFSRWTLELRWKLLGDFFSMNTLFRKVQNLPRIIANVFNVLEVLLYI